MDNSQIGDFFFPWSAKPQKQLTDQRCCEAAQPRCEDEDEDSEAMFREKRHRVIRAEHEGKHVSKNGLGWFRHDIIGKDITHMTFG